MHIERMAGCLRDVYAGLAAAGPHHREPADARGGGARAAQRQRSHEARGGRGGAPAAQAPRARARGERRALLHACAIREQVYN